MGNMSADNLKANLTNVARRYLWEVLWSNPIGGGDANTMSLRAQSTSVPGSSFGSILVPFRQTPGVKFPGKLTMPHTWTVTFIEGLDGKIFESIYNWKQLIVHDLLGVGGPDSVIKSNAYLNLLDQNGVKTTTRFQLSGIYPELMDDTPLSYDDESALLYTVTWSYDNWQKIS